MIPQFVGLDGMMSRFVKLNNNNPDLYSSASSSSNPGSCFSLDLCPDLVLAVIAAAAAAGAYFLYITITQAGRRKRRSPSVVRALGEVLISGADWS